KVPLKDDAKAITETTPHYSDITIRNLSGTSTREAGIIAGLPESLIEGVTLENVSIEAAKTGLEIRNARRVQVKDSKIEPKKSQPYIRRDSEVEGAIGAAK